MVTDLSFNALLQGCFPFPSLRAHLATTRSRTCEHAIISPCRTHRSVRAILFHADTPAHTRCTKQHAGEPAPINASHRSPESKALGSTIRYLRISRRRMMSRYRCGEIRLR
jgi:hypothetical protein